MTESMQALEDYAADKQLNTWFSFTARVIVRDPKTGQEWHFTGESPDAAAKKALAGIGADLEGTP